MGKACWEKLPPLNLTFHAAVKGGGGGEGFSGPAQPLTQDFCSLFFKLFIKSQFVPLIACQGMEAREGLYG